MLSAIKRRQEREDEGFTLIELMVVVLIIAILLAIAIPTFLGARNSANARAAQSNLRNALTAEQTYWTNNQAFADTAVGTIESSLNWVAAWPTGTAPANTVLAAESDSNNIVVLTAYGKDGNCWSIAQVNDPNPASPVPSDGTYYSKVKAASANTCSSPSAPTATTNANGPDTTNTATNGTSGTWYSSF